MQSAPDAPIDFADLDLFVRSYQDAGFTVLTVALKPHNRWASKDVGLLGAENASPKAEYRALFAEWVTRVVERYDGDGIEDMPGLRWPVALFEIGSEFSSYQPEPVADYLATLEIAYRAAHRANPGVRVAHAAFLTTPVDLDVADPAGYEAAWARTPRHDLHHGLADQRAVLDRPEIFDVINLHNLGAPAELEHQLRWLAHETGRRGYRKPVIVSDTIPTSYIAWGPATDCTGGAQGVLIPPATEADRCRLAAFFRKLVDGDPATLAWTRGFVAADHVQRTVIAAEQGVEGGHFRLGRRRQVRHEERPGAGELSPEPRDRPDDGASGGRHPGRAGRPAGSRAPDLQAHPARGAPVGRLAGPGPGAATRGRQPEQPSGPEFAGPRGLGRAGHHRDRPRQAPAVAPPDPRRPPNRRTQPHAGLHPAARIGVPYEPETAGRSTVNQATTSRAKTKTPVMRNRLQ
jgi:hypothetical protein